MAPEIAALKEAICAAEVITLASHVNPDGDNIGALLALAIGLRNTGKEVRVFSHDPIPANLMFLPQTELIEILPEGCSLPDVASDLGIIVDVSVIDRMGRSQSILASARHLAVIDHHEPSDTPPGDIRIIDSSASATCLILYKIFPELGIAMSPDIAQCLLTGIATDTGSFRFQNTDPASLDAASHLVELGANLSEINLEVWEKKPLSSIILLSRALNKMRLRADGRLVFTSISREDFESSGALDEHSEGIVNDIGRVDTALIAALFREPKKGRIRVSVRSRGNIDVSAVCRNFGGGGHVNAAGCTFESTIEEAMSSLLPALEECLESYS